MKLERVFCWKVLSEDGLLKDHRPLGPYYSETSFNDEFKTEEDAVEAFVKWKKLYEYGIAREMVLLTIYRQVWE